MAPGAAASAAATANLLVDRPEPLPCGPPVAVEPGPAGPIPQPVQTKPQRLVGDDVVVGPVVVRIDHDGLNPEPLGIEEPLPSRLFIVRSDTGRHPQGPVALHSGAQGDDQASTPATGRQRPVVSPGDAERAPVRKHQEVVGGGHRWRRQYPALRPPPRTASPPGRPLRRDRRSAGAGQHWRDAPRSCRTRQVER